MKINEILRHPLKAAAEDWRDGTPVLKPIVAYFVAISAVALLLMLFGVELGASSVAGI